MSAAAIIYLITGAVIAGLHIYIQLVIGDNWPPKHWRCIQWDVVAVIFIFCLIAWPLAVICMFLDGSYQQSRAALLKRKMRAMS